MFKLRYVVAVVSLSAALVINLAALAVRATAQAEAQASNRAALIVQFQDGTLLTRCVSFSEPQITGYDLLRRAKVSLIADFSMGGTTVCKIDKSGCSYPAQNCFCDCQDLNNTCTYWMYYFQAGGAWKYAALGAAVQKVSNGDVNGWIYGQGNSSSGGATPPLTSFDQICGEAAAPAPTAAPAATAVPTAHAPTVEPTAAAALEPTAISAATIAPTKTPQAASTSAPTSTPESTPAPSATPASPATATSEPTTTSAAPTASATAAQATAPTATQAPRATSTPGPTEALADQSANGAPPNALGYVVFAGIAVVLAGALVVMSRRGPAKGSRGK